MLLHACSQQCNCFVFLLVSIKRNCLDGVLCFSHTNSYWNPTGSKMDFSTFEEQLSTFAHVEKEVLLADVAGPSRPGDV